MPDPKLIHCETCEAPKGRLCSIPRGHAPLGFALYHASRRARVGCDDGPLSVRYRHIKSGLYRHGCGEKITVHYDGDVSAASNGKRCGHSASSGCPTCNRTVWIEDLGPVEISLQHHPTGDELANAETPPHPEKGDLITFWSNHDTKAQGYIHRVFRSGAFTVHLLHPDERGRRCHVEPCQLIAVHKNVRLHEQQSLTFG